MRTAARFGNEASLRSVHGSGTVKAFQSVFSSSTVRHVFGPGRGAPWGSGLNGAPSRGQGKLRTLRSLRATAPYGRTPQNAPNTSRSLQNAVSVKHPKGIRKAYNSPSLSFERTPRAPGPLPGLEVPLRAGYGGVFGAHRPARDGREPDGALRGGGLPAPGTGGSVALRSTDRDAQLSDGMSTRGRTWVVVEGNVGSRFAPAKSGNDGASLCWAKSTTACFPVSLGFFAVCVLSTCCKS